MMHTASLASTPHILQVPMMAILGMPAYVCASGATPFVAVLIHKGLSPGAAIAFLLTGPATNITTFGVLSSLHGRRVAWIFGATVTLLATVLGLALDQWISITPVIALDQASHHEASALQLACLAVLTLAMVLSIFRQGPRGILGQIFNYPHGDDHNHGHHHHEPATHSGAT